MVRGGGDVLGKGTRAPAEYLIPWPQLCHAVADRLDRPRDIGSRNTVLWLAHSVRRARDVRNARDHHPITDMDRSRVNAYQYLAILDHRLGDALDL